MGHLNCRLWLSTTVRCLDLKFDAPTKSFFPKLGPIVMNLAENRLMDFVERTDELPPKITIQVYMLLLRCPRS